MHKKKSKKFASSVLSIFLIGTLLFTSTIFSSFNTSSSQQVFAQQMNPYEPNNSYDNDNNYVPYYTANMQQTKTNMNVRKVHLKAFS